MAQQQRVGGRGSFSIVGCVSRESRVTSGYGPYRACALRCLRVASYKYSSRCKDFPQVDAPFSECVEVDIRRIDVATYDYSCTYVVTYTTAVDRTTNSHLIRSVTSVIRRFSYFDGMSTFLMVYD